MGISEEYSVVESLHLDEQHEKQMKKELVMNGQV